MSKLLLQAFSYCTLVLLSFQASAQQELVKDINPGGGWAEFEYLFHIGTDFYFNANGDQGREMWISDGTPAGTEVLVDINPGFVSSNPSNFVELNDTWYFSADNGVTGSELWKTDGSATGTSIVKDIHPGFPSSEISEIVNIGGVLYFQATDGASGFEMWKSDGTLAGTVMVADINPGASSASPEQFTLMGGEIYFSANDGTNGKELWKTDGTMANTQMVADVYTGAMSSFPDNITAVGSYVYFTGDDGLTGSEVYKSDGTAAGTSQQGDINPGIAPSNANDLTAVGDYLFLVANDGVNGTELWRSNSLSATPNLEMVELFAGAFSSEPSNFILLNGDLLFNANDGATGYELWKANNSDGAVTFVKDISAGINSSFPVMLEVLNNEVIFSAKDSAIGIELWKTDGTEAGTVLLGDLNPDPDASLTDSNPISPFKQNNTLYFTATDQVNGWQIWRTDGTMSTTQRLTAMPHDTIFNNTYKPYAVNATDNTIVNFVALGDPFGEELWKYSLDPVSITNVTDNSPLACAGDTNGSFEIEIGGGVGDLSCYSYSWSDPSITGLSATNLPAGDYIVTINDCVGFTVSTTVTIAEPAPIILTTTLMSDASCFGLNDGSATVAGTGGNTPYTYVWDNGEMTDLASSLTAGMHMVTVTDATNCTSVESVVVGEPSEVAVTATAGPTSCFGSNSGTATAVGAGGLGGYAYEWDNGEMTAMATSLSGGMHTVTATDMNGCSSTTTIMINTSASIELSFSSQNASCVGVLDGSATVTPTGGSGSGFTYMWTGGATTATAMNLEVGTYTVTVTDSNGCTSLGSVNVEGPTSSIVALSSVSCSGEMDGQAEVVITGGAGIYSYLWDNGEMTPIASMLGAGMHTVTVSDGMTCSFTETIMIGDAAALVLMDSSFVIPSCPGDANGVVTVTPTGGSAPYYYIWSTGDTTSLNVLTGLTGDETYCVTITDDNNCGEIVHCTYLVNPPQIVNSFINAGLTSCSGSCDATATAIGSGGTAGSGVYDYTWSNGEMDLGVDVSIATQLCVGDIYVTISDGICAIVDTITITSPLPINSTTITNNVSCFGLSDGSIDLMVEGGIPPYTYSGPTTDLPAGSYDITVTDANGCVHLVTDIEVNEPAELTATTTSTPANPGEGGTATALVDGGTEPYTYSWNSAPVQTTQTATDLPTGVYSVTVTDTNGCTTTSTVEVDMTDAVGELLELQQFDLSPNPAESFLMVDIALERADEIRLELFNAVGKLMSNQEIEQLQRQRVRLDVSNYSQGVYWVRLTTSEGQIAKRVVLAR